MKLYVQLKKSNCLHVMEREILLGLLTFGSLNCLSVKEQLTLVGGGNGK